MRNLDGKTAVITGAGNGIGRAMAIRCASEGMNVVLADLRESELLQLEEEIRQAGASCLAVVTDVTESAQLESLAQATISVFGTVDLLFNNAGVIRVSPILDYTQKDWEWVLGVNLFGVIHSTRIFSPIMIKQGTESHIVNNASIAGFTTGAGLASYKISKHAVVAFSEILEAELAETQVGVSVLCTGWANTKLMESEESRPVRLRNDLNPTQDSPDIVEHKRKARESAANGEEPGRIAQYVLEAVIDKQFYIISDNSFHEKFRLRVDRILNSPPLNELILDIK